MSSTLIETMKWWAANRPDQPALVAGARLLNYAELDAWADAIGDWLCAEGLQPGERVSILAGNSLEWCVFAQGVMRAGGLLAPINPRFTVAEATHMTEHYAPRWLLHDAARATMAGALAANHADLRLADLAVIHEHRWRAQASGVRPIDADTAVVIIATSGSTAFPKGVVYSHRTMLGAITDLALSEPQAFEQARVQLFGPLSASSGYVVLTQALAFGGTVFIEEAFDAERALQGIVDNRITLVIGAPVFFERMAASPRFATADLSSLRLCEVGGARVSQQLLQAWLDKGVVLRQMYGQTEAGGTASINAPGNAIAHPEHCGCGMPFTRIAILDSDGVVCPAGVPGEITIRGPGVMVGYWNDAEATARTLVDGWLRSGDLGMVDERGQLTYIDRLKDIIISGGLNISAAEVERVIAAMPGVVEVAVIAAKDERFGETPLAVVHVSAGIDPAALVAHCNAALSDFKVPRYVAIESEALPRLATGKISKRALREKYADAHQRLPRLR